MLNGLDLFSGIGGLTLALSEWVRPVAYCECDRYCQAVLLSRQRSLDLPEAPIWDDVCTLGKGAMELSCASIDIIYAGFPCQDLSVAGHGKGLEGERSGLYKEIVRLVSDLRPRFTFIENVAVLSQRGLEQISMDFANLRYDLRWTTVSAKEVGASHERKRVFLLAHVDSPHLRISKEQKQECKKTVQPRSIVENGENSDIMRASLARSWNTVGNETTLAPFTDAVERDDWNTAASVFLRLDHGIPYRAHRISALGNAVVPLQAREAFKRLMGL